MSSIRQLDPVIRMIPKKDQVGVDEELVVFESQEKNLLGFRKKRYFAVSNINTAKCTGISYMLSNAIPVQIQYSVSCPTGNEEKAVAALYKQGLSLGESLNRKVKGWFTKFVEEFGENTVLKNRSTVHSYLKDQALQETGLVFTAEVKLQNEEKLQEFTVGPITTNVRVSDYDEALSLTIKAELQVDESKQDIALLSYSKLPEIKDSFQAYIKKHLRDKVKLQQFCTQLNRDLKDELFEALDKIPQSVGRKLSYLNLHSSSIPSIYPVGKEEVEVSHKGSYSIADYDEEVTVENKLILRLDDIAIVRNSAVKDVSLRLKEKEIPSIVKNILFDKSYKDVLLELDEIKEDIKSQIEKKVKLVGYNVQQHAFLPELKELKLLNEGFKLEIDGPFVTSDSRVSISVQVTCSGQIGDLSELDKRLLLPATDIDTEMKEAVSNAVEEVIHEVDPERAYIGFDYKHKNYERSVKEEIELKVRDVLIEKFKASNPSLKIFVKQTTSEVTEKATKLTESSHDFESLITPRRNNKYVEKLNYHIRFSIRGVYPDGWPIFQNNIKRSSDEEIEEVKKILEENVRTYFEAVPYQEHLSGQLKIKKLLNKLLAETVLPRVGKMFGLRLELVSLNRHDSPLEVEAQKTRHHLGLKEEETNRSTQERLLNSGKETMEELLKKRKELLTEGEYDEAEEVEEQIEKIRSEFSYDDIKGLNETTDKKLLESSEEEFSWDEFKDLLTGLPEGKEQEEDNEKDHEKTTD